MSTLYGFLLIKSSFGNWFSKVFSSRETVPVERVLYFARGVQSEFKKPFCALKLLY